jgi:hypothetical protein
MLIKQADDQSGAIAELERLAFGTGADAKRAAEELRRRRAGIKGESESAYLIDFEFAKSKNWAVIHDLRLEHEGRVAQIDHLLINRFMDFYVLESKHFHAGLKITEDGEFLRWNAFRKSFEGMASPLEQNERHIAVLREVVGQIELPVRLGVRIPASFATLILVASSARIDRPKHFDTSRIVKADQLKTKIWKDIDDENALLMLLKATKMVSSETVEFVARQLAMLHKPLERVATPQTLSAPTKAKSQPASKAHARAATPKPVIGKTQAVASGPMCKSCSKTTGDILYGKYGYYLKCAACEANTNIRFTCQPGHNPRLRKEGLVFYRECAECGSSDVFYRNAGGKEASR